MKHFFACDRDIHDGRLLFLCTPTLQMPSRKRRKSSRSRRSRRSSRRSRSFRGIRAQVGDNYNVLSAKSVSELQEQIETKIADVTAEGKQVFLVGGMTRSVGINGNKYFQTVLIR